MLPNPGEKGPGSKNLLLAVVLAGAVLIGFQYFGPKPEQKVVDAIKQAQIETSASASGQSLPSSPTNPQASVNSVGVANAQQTARVNISSDLVHGSIALKGGRLDSLTLAKHFQTLADEKEVVQLSPVAESARYFDAGWLGYNGVKAPNGNTVWTAPSGAELKPGAPLTITWENGDGQRFERTFSLEDSNYVVKVSDRVVNTSSDLIQLSHYAQIHHAGGLDKGEQSTFVNHIGPTGLVDEVRAEEDYDDIKSKDYSTKGSKGWWAISSRYFINAILPDEGQKHNFEFKHSKLNSVDFYTALVQSDVQSIPAGSFLERKYSLYSGPKQYKNLAMVGNSFDQAVEYGWFSMIAKPIFKVMMWIFSHVGNLGIAIIAVTIILKLILWPLAVKSYRSMAIMKKIQPEMQKLKEKHGEDRQAFTMAMMKMYSEHKVNPMSGCWPVLMQIPIFFAMYKVILVSFEFRHEPFIGWIIDLSEKDPFFVLPILMGISMLVQMRLNPPAADPVQQKVMQFMPIIFTVMFLMFPSGLVLYWLTNNVFSVAQQYFIMRKMGLHLDVKHMDMERD